MVTPLKGFWQPANLTPKGGNASFLNGVSIYRKFPKIRPLWTNALPLFNFQVLYIGIFTPCKASVFRECLVSFWCTSVIDWVCKDVRTTLLSRRFWATAIRFLLLALGTRDLAWSCPLITTDDASSLGASWLSINASTADFPQYTFSKATVLAESRDSHHDCRIHAYSRLQWPHSSKISPSFSHSLCCIYQLSLVEPCQDCHQQERSRRR